ncbi:[protein-PII] uridylyltransferase [Francisellaceae bacterium]|nr:[protein-PII] uridylyltransferase [Francisellaceae bacterium]
MAQLTKKSIIKYLKHNQVSTQEIDSLLDTINQQGIDHFLSDPDAIYNIMSEQCVLITTLLRLLFPKNINATLITIGGFGRQELHPYSDLDLLILIDSHSEKNHAEIETFIQKIWDCKNRKIAHSVRTFDEIIDDAENDVSFFTALLESRPIAGNIRSYQKIQEIMSNHQLMSKEEFFQEKYEEQQIRNYKFSSNLEPNIKNSQGNLRYTHTIRWLIFYCFNFEKPSFLTTSGIITRLEFHSLLSAHKTLSKLRYALHILAGRDENRLLFEYQKKLAEIFNYPGDENQKPVEQLMRRYYQCTFDIKAISKIIISAIAESLFMPADNTNYTNIRGVPFRVCNHLIDTETPNTETIEVEYIFEPFIMMSTNNDIKGLTSNCVRALIETSHNMPNYQNASEQVKSKFISFFKCPHQIAKQLQSMLSLGILEAYISNITNIKARMQFDLFHVHTVDQHTIQVVQHMENIINGSLDNKFPEISEIFRNVNNTYLLYLAAFFHDMGKGSGRDHSEYGAEIAEEFCSAHSLSDEDSELIVWLVKNHLQMSLIAQKKDITDIEVIQEFVKSANTNMKVDCLLLLTVADILGTNIDLWNDWKANLLLRLHRSARQLINSPNVQKLQQTQLGENEHKKQSIINRLQLTEEETNQVRAFWDTLPEAYFNYNTANVMKWQVQNIGVSDLPKEKTIFIKYYPRLKQCMLTTYFPRVKHIFYGIIQQIDSLNLSITEARVYLTSNSYLLGQFVITNQDGSNISDPKLISYIQKKMLSGLSSPIKNILTRRRNTKVKNNVFDIQTSAIITNEDNKYYSTVTVRTLNGPSILVRIAQVFYKHNLRVLQAKINTIGETVEDYFHISTITDQPILDQKIQDSICQDIVKALS